MEHVFNIGMTYALLDAIHYVGKWRFLLGHDPLAKGIANTTKSTYIRSARALLKHPVRALLIHPDINAGIMRVPPAQTQATTSALTPALSDHRRTHSDSALESPAASAASRPFMSLRKADP